MTTRFLIGGGVFFSCILGTILLAGQQLRAEEAVQPFSRVTIEEARSAVVKEFRARGLKEDQWPGVEDVEMPVAVPARDGRRLQVSSVCWDAQTAHALFRLECTEPGACLPFLVYVRSASHARATTCQIVPKQPAAAHAPEPAVRAGERATAVLIAAGLRVTAEVTCLDRGGRGEIIRVRGAEGHVFRARVSGREMVEALPE